MPTTIWKVYDAQNEHVGSLKYAADAAELVGKCGDGATIRYGHKGGVVWAEGSEEVSATASLGLVIETINSRARFANSERVGQQNLRQEAFAAQFRARPGQEV